MLIILYEYLCTLIDIYKNHNKIFHSQLVEIIFELIIESPKNILDYFPRLNQRKKIILNY